jgi:CubicO group peptidase (beta-lactamase class C family)
LLKQACQPHFVLTIAELFVTVKKQNTMKTMIFRSLLLVPAILAMFAGYSQVNATIPVDRIDSLMQRAVAMDLYSGNILIVHDLRVAYEKSFGKADYENNIPNTPETKFQLASVTKDFTRVMILQLAEQHKLSLEGTIGQYLTGFSQDVNKVTVGQLLDFTSGLGDYHTSAEFQQLDKKSVIIRDLIPIIQKEKLQFEPGTQFLYSNSGYVVLGAIIEKVTNKNYYENLKELILDRLDLHNTGMNGYIPPMPGIATGYLTNQPGALQNNSQWHFAGGGDGGIYTTTHDLLKFITSVFFDNSLLSDSSKLKYASGKMSPVKFNSWDDFLKSGRYSPAGGAPGVSTLFTVNMKTRNIGIFLSNYDEGTAEEIGMRISAILNGKPVQPLHQPASKYLYTLIKTKGGKYFEENYKQEMQNSGMRPDDDMVLLNIGQKLTEEKDYGNAISLYNVYTKEFPDIIIAWNELGEIYLSEGIKTEAGKCFQAALKLSPGNKRAQKGLEKSK